MPRSPGDIQDVCRSCGQSLEDGATFCVKCGEKQQAVRKNSKDSTGSRGSGRKRSFSLERLRGAGAGDAAPEASWGNYSTYQSSRLLGPTTGGQFVFPVFRTQDWVMYIHSYAFGKLLFCCYI